MGSLCHICKLQREEQNHGAVFLFPSASSIPKEDAQLQGTNTDTLELLIPLSLLPTPPPPSRPSRMDSHFCFGKLSGIRVGEGE